MTRCDVTDLLVDQCGCPQHRGGITPDEEIQQTRAALLSRPGWFRAQYSGICGGCGGKFQAGAAITFMADVRLSPRSGALDWKAECCA